MQGRGGGVRTRGGGVLAAWGRLGSGVGAEGGACRGVGRRKGGVGLVLPRCAAAVWGRCEGGVRKACYGVLWCEGCVGG